MEVKARKVAEGALCQYSIDNFFAHFEGFFQHGIFHGITILQESKLLKIRDKKGMLIIEWE